MKKETFFALMTMRILNLGFTANQSLNPDMVCFENSKGNRIYMTLKENSIDMNVMRISKTCYNPKIVSYSESIIEEVASKIKTNLKLTHDIFKLNQTQS